jgi:putative cardiolipin synthase
MHYRKPLLQSGVELFELKSMREDRPDRSLPEMLAGSASGLHAKVFGFDGERVFIGSYNLDPRSARLNTEMGILVESPTLAASLSDQFDDDAFRYQVKLDDRDELIWIETLNDGSTRTFDVEPDTKLFKRALVRVIGWFPIEWLL